MATKTIAYLPRVLRYYADSLPAFCSGLLALAGAAVAAPGAFAALPPLIDRDLLFGDPEIEGGQISPDGRLISFLKPFKGVVNIWVKGREEAFVKARPITSDTKRPVRIYFWSEDSRLLLYGQDKGGDENFGVYAVDPRAVADPATGVPPSRDLTPYEKVTAEIIAVPEKTPGQILVGLNDRDPEVHDVYRLDLTTGRRDLVIKNTENVAAWVSDLDGKIRLGIRMDKDGGTEVLRVEGGTLVPAPLYRCTSEESCQPIRFHKDGKRVYLSTDKGSEDLARLILLDAATGREERVESDPEKEVDFGGADFSDATDELIATFYVGDRLRTYPRDPIFAKDWDIVRKALPDGDLYFGSSTEDDRLRLVTVTSDVDPGATYLYDRTAGQVELLYRPYPKLPIRHLAAVKPVRYPARDGLVISAYITLPKGVAPKNLPAVLLPHGGPWGRDIWGYDPFGQLLANRGYAVLQPNFRGSQGFGKKFLNLGNGQWGTGTMQHDLTDGAKWLATEGVADPKRIAIMGISYGGYATLAGLSFTPDLYAAGVDIVGPSSIVTLLQSIPPYWAPMKKLFAVRVGDLEKPAEVARMKSQSPLEFASAIKAPLLVVQGANDPRVKQAESEQIVMALRDLGRPVEYLLAPDEGHGFAGKENRLAMMAVIERFLARHIGGRYQEGMVPEIAAKVAALTVDPKTVRLHPREEAATTLAAFAPDKLRPGTYRYALSGTIMGRAVAGTATWSIATETKDGRSGFAITEESKMPMGDSTDTTFLDGETLLPVSRSMKQGPMSVDLHFSPDAVRGSMKAMGNEMPIETKLDGPVLMDGAPLQIAVSTLPLSRGYKTALKSFDLQSAKVAGMALEVEGEEQVGVPAGTFETYRVAVRCVDSPGASTLWIERTEPRRVVKWAVTLPPQTGGGKLAGELIK